MGFHTNKKNIFGGIQYPKLKDLSLDSDSASERIEDHFSDYVPAHIYSVMRSEKWKLICKHIFEKEYNFFIPFSLPNELILAKPNYFSAEGPNRLKSAANGVALKNARVGLWIDKNFKEEKKEFLYGMKKACDSLSIDQNFKFSENEISKLFEVYIDKILNKRLIEKNFFNRVINLISYKKFLASLSYETKKMIKKFIRVKP